MIKLMEILRGGRQSLMMKGMTGKSLGYLNLGEPDEVEDAIEINDFEDPDELKGIDEENVNELHFTGDMLNKVRSDVFDFLKSEHKKLGYPNPLDTYHLIQQILDSTKIISKVKGIR